MENSISEQKKTGIALLCDMEGRVVASLRDDPALVEHLTLPVAFQCIVEKGSSAKAEGFIREVIKEGAAFDWELNAQTDRGKIILLHFHGCVYGETIFIVGLSSTDVPRDFLNELLSINNDQAADLRNAMKKIFGYMDDSRASVSDDAYSKMISLNNEMANLQRELYKKNTELESLNRLKNEFLGMAVHDLRNPLNAIMGFSQFLIGSDDPPLQPDQARILNNIYSASRFMFRIVEELLDISSIESGSLNLDITQTDYVDLVKTNIELNSCLARQKDMEIQFVQENEVPLVEMDAGKIEQVLNNLISNAVKFSHPGALVTVTVKTQGAAVMTTVEDRGQGIPEEEKNKLFKPFQKLTVKPTSGEKSTGLGLAIAKKIIEGHGGTIGVESRCGEGSVFSFSLPVKQ